MNERVYELLNDQINKELFSAYKYMVFADYYESVGLGGYANWYMIQAAEERDHALIFRRYLIENGCPIVNKAIDDPSMHFESDIEPLKEGLHHEQYVTSLINDIFEAAVEAKDYRTQNFLAWFIEEQLEEEDSAQTMIDQMERFGSDSRSLYELDREYASRSYTVPSPLAKD